VRKDGINKITKKREIIRNKNKDERKLREIVKQSYVNEERTPEGNNQPVKQLTLMKS
jgi:hypothetical protein